MNRKVVLVTGASAGIGKAIAKQLLKDGLVVYVAARRLEKMHDLEKLGAIALKMDVTSEEEMGRAINRITTAHDGVDVLVNNAGYASYGSVEETTVEDARRQFEVNLFGLARLTQLVIPAMRHKGAGTIINMSSMGGKIYTPLGAWYHATKHALEGWSDCLRLELAQFGIEVVIIEPGGIESEFSEVMMSPMLERSGDGPYAAWAKSLQKASMDMNEHGRVSPPSVIADLVSEAVKANKPKTRYVAGYMAKPALFLRWLLPDRWFDSIIRRASL